jgi:hypothetical protein
MGIFCLIFVTFRSLGWKATMYNEMTYIIYDQHSTVISIFAFTERKDKHLKL